MSKVSSARRRKATTGASGRKILSFFSGALGLDIGLHQAGLHCISLNEFDKAACRHHPEKSPPPLSRVELRSSTKTTQESYPLQFCARTWGSRQRSLFAIVGGPPCQAFSTAGKRLGLNDERGNVFLHFIELITGLRPKYAIFENVRGILSAPLVHRPHNERAANRASLVPNERPGGALLHILSILEASGYKATFNLYNTANYGVPQARERVIFFASRDGASVPYIDPTHDEMGRQGLPKWRTLHDAVSGLDASSLTAGKFPESRLQYYRFLGPGQNWRNLPVEIQREAMGASFHAGGGKTGFFRRLAWDKPSPTLVTCPTMPATDLCHPVEPRPLSVEEYAAVQTFPSDYVFEGSLADKYRQIGNAVPCHFGRLIGEHIIAFDEGRLQDAGPSKKLSRYTGTGVCELERYDPP